MAQVPSTSFFSRFSRPSRREPDAADMGTAFGLEVTLESHSPEEREWLGEFPKARPAVAPRPSWWARLRGRGH